jgi:hypothetical protein
MLDRTALLESPASGSNPADAGAADRSDSVDERCRVEAPWTQIWFDGPDEAYLVAAAIRRHLDAMVVVDLLLVPTSRGPALELPRAAAEDPLVRALVRRFGGHIDGQAVADRVRAGCPGDRPAVPP